MLENMDRVLSRMQQLEQKFDRGPQIDSEGFQKMMGETQNKQKSASAPKLTPEQMYKLNTPFGFDPSQFGSPRANAADVQPLAQSNGISCGQTSVAMTINALTGQNLRDTDIDAKYGFELLRALKEECAPSGFTFKDGGEVSADKWELIEHKVNKEKIPVIVALNGPEFSPSGRGHIVTITKVEGDTVEFADPATGVKRTTTKSAMNNAPQHPDGNFIFYGVREDNIGGFAGRIP